MDEQQLTEFIELMLELRQAMHQQSALSIEERVGSGLQVAALHYLERETQTNVSGLANQLHISLSSATQLAERLVKAEFVDRKIDDLDRRITNLTLTSNGKIELERCEEAMRSKMGLILRQLAPADRADLIRILRSLTRALTT